MKAFADLNRREFLAGASAFACLPAVAGPAQPLWRAGLLSDTHVGETMESCSLFRKACEVFAAQGVDLVVHTGDIADLHYPSGYRAIRAVMDETFAKRRPEELWVYAYHDFIGRTNEPYEAVLADIRRGLGGTNEAYVSRDFRGIPLVVFPQKLDLARGERMLREACERHPDPKTPILVFDHLPPFDTTSGSVKDGWKDRRDLYARFPRVVDICGHSHGSLRDPAMIWQGEFTAVNLACLQQWGGSAVGTSPSFKKAYGAVVLEVYADRLTFRRFDVRDGREYRAECPWCVPLPFDPATAPYRPVALAAGEPVPEFAPGAALSLADGEGPFTSLTVRIPAVGGSDDAYQYRLEIEDEKGRRFARQDQFGQFHLRPEDRAEAIVAELSAGYFEADRDYRIVVTPVNRFGRGGRPLSAAFHARRPAAELVWECRDPMKDCTMMSDWTGGHPVERDGDWYRAWYDDQRLLFPDAAMWAGEKGARFRFTVDLEMEQEESATWTIVLRNPVTQRNANNRIATPRGKSGPMRLVIDFAKKHREGDYHLLVREGGRGRIRFDYVKVERLP